MKKLSLLSVLMLSACATAPEPKIITKTVNVPTPVACIDAKSIPAKPASVTLPTDARQAAAIAASQALAYGSWGDELMALIGPCTKP